MSALAQVWTIIGAVGGIVALQTTLLVLVINAKFETVSAQFDGLSVRIGLLETRVQAVEVALMKPPVAEQSVAGGTAP